MRELQTLDLKSLAESFGLVGENEVDRKPLGDVLERRFPQGNHGAQGEFVLDFFVDFPRNTDGVGFRQPLESRSHVHAIAKYVAILLDDVAGMDADTDMNLVSLSCLRIIGAELGLKAWAHWTALTTEGKSTKNASPTVLMTTP